MVRSLQRSFPLIVAEMPGGRCILHESPRANEFRKEFERRRPRKKRGFWLFSWNFKLPLPEAGLLQLMVEFGLASNTEEARQNLSNILNQIVYLVVEGLPSGGEYWWGFQIESAKGGGYKIQTQSCVGL